MHARLSIAAATLMLAAGVAGAQQPTPKPAPVDTSVKAKIDTAQTDTTARARVQTILDIITWTGPLGYTLRPGAALYCAASDSAEVAKVEIKSDLYQAATMISPEQAKALALCAVPGQLASGEMQTADGRTIYDISLLPRDKKTYTKIQIDAASGEVINAKQFGGLRGLAGFLRESAERRENKAKAP